MCGLLFTFDINPWNKLRDPKGGGIDCPEMLRNGGYNSNWYYGNPTVALIMKEAL